MGIVGEILVAEQHAVLIEARGEQPDPPLKIVVPANAHGGGVPPISKLVANGAAVTRSGDEAAGLAGEGVALLQREGAQGTVAHIYTVSIGIVLCAGAGVLQIILSVVLRHKSSLDIGLAYGEKHGRHSFGRVAAQILHARGKFNFPRLGVEHML